MGDLRFDPDLIRALKFYGTIGFNLAGSMILGFIGGQLLDARFGTGPILAVLGFLMGAISGFWGVWRLAMRDFIEDDRRKRARRASRHSEIARDRNQEKGRQ